MSIRSFYINPCCDFLTLLIIWVIYSYFLKVYTYKNSYKLPKQLKSISAFGIFTSSNLFYEAKGSFPVSISLILDFISLPALFNEIFNFEK